MSEASIANLETGLAEASHRARNDLQAVMAMLQLQATKSADPGAREALLEAERRVRALSSLNARLDAHAEGVATTIDSMALLDGLATDLRAIHFGQRPIALCMEASRHRIPVVHARPVGLILNELVVNALKHAFPGGRAGTVTLEFHCRCGECFLTVRDDGVGMDRGVLPRGTGLGRRIVRALAAQVGGVVEVGPGRDGTGVECTVRWPAAKLDCELL